MKQQDAVFYNRLLTFLKYIGIRHPDPNIAEVVEDWDMVDFW